MSERMVYICLKSPVMKGTQDLLLWRPTARGRFLILGGSFDPGAPLDCDPMGDGVSRGCLRTAVLGWRLRLSPLEGKARKVPLPLRSCGNHPENTIMVDGIAEIRAVRPEDLLLYVGLKTKTRLFDKALKNTLREEYKDLRRSWVSAV